MRIQAGEGTCTCRLFLPPASRSFTPVPFLRAPPLPPPPQVEDLARISFKHKPLYVGVDDARTVATREGLEQGYCVVPADKKFLLLFTFLKKNANKKVPARARVQGGRGRVRAGEGGPLVNGALSCDVGWGGPGVGGPQGS